MTKATTTMTTVMTTVAIWAMATLTGCGGAPDDPGVGGAGGAGGGAPSQGTTAPGSGATEPDLAVKLPSKPTEEAAPTGVLDPQLVGVWPVTSVQVYWDGMGVPDGSVSDPLRVALASTPLLLVGDGNFSFGPVTGTWTVIPFVAADKALWGTGGRGPDGYAREIALVVGGKLYARGPIDDATPPGTSPWGLRLGFRVASPQAGNVLVMLQRLTTSTGGGTKK